MLNKSNLFHDLIVEVRALTESRDPSLLFEDLHTDSLDGEYHFTTSKKTLLMMSRVIEDSLKLHKKRCLLYSGFQELTRFSEYRDRYKKLAAYAGQIFVIGIADTHVDKIADNVHILTKNADIIRENWISIIRNDTIHISLIAQEVPSRKQHQKYVGFYTNSRALTEKVVNILTDKNILSDIPISGRQTYFNF